MAIREDIYRELNRTSKNSIGWQPRINEWPRIPAMIIASFLKRFHFIHPEHLVLTGFSCLILAGILILFSYENYTFLTAILIILGMVLDYADGQLARATGRVRSVGALCDLAADFISSSFLFFSIAYSLIPYYESRLGVLIVLTIFSLISHYISSSCWAYLEWRINQPKQPCKKMKAEFHKHPINDYQNGKYYQKQFAVLRLFFDITWGISGKIATYLPIWRERSGSKLVFSLMSVSALGIQLSFLAGFVFFKVNLAYFLYLEIALLVLLIVAIALSELDYEKELKVTDNHYSFNS